MKKMQEKSKIYNIQDKVPTPPQTNPYGWQTPISNSRRQQPKLKVSQRQKTILPLKTRRMISSPSNQGNQIRRQTQQKASTPPEVENTRFHQLSFDTPQDKHKPLKQQGKSKRI
jgi:hypothetical protein